MKLLFLVFLTSVTGLSLNDSKKETENYRLPETIFPEKYNVTLEPRFSGNFTFSGSAEIEAKVVKKTNEIVVHHRRMNLQEYRVFKNKIGIKILNATYNEVTEKFTMVLDSDLLVGSIIRIVFQFEGILSDDNTGFYRSSYYDPRGRRRWLAITQFEQTYARAAFPCFDEPLFKAKFTLSIRRSKNLTAITNMPRYASEETSDSVLDKFQESPRMSSYLVAILVSDFQYLTQNQSNVGIWAKPDSIEYGNYALQFGTKVLQFYEHLFGIKNPVPKTDMVAVPDFNAGAMENWGLITYRETRLLYDDNETSIDAKQAIASVISHECCHMWFGNLLSPKWWEFTWLSEGFARYYQYMATSKIESDWKIDQQFLVDVVQPTFHIDSDSSSPAISHPASNQNEVANMFGQITYSKGGSVIRMMEQSFGSAIFLDTLREYLANNKFGNVDSDDFWRALQNQVKKHGFKLNSTVKSVMDDWITKPGYPVITVRVSEDLVTLSQKRFFLNATDTDVNATWYIPITYASATNPNFTSAVTNTWMEENMTIRIANVSDDWIVFNVFGAGFYRVNYDDNSWYRIINTLKSPNYEKIHELNRAAIVNDLLTLARAELLDYEIALDGLQYLTRETNYLPWKSALTGLQFLTRKFTGLKEYELYRKYVLNLTGNVYGKIGFEDRKNDDAFTVLLRRELNFLACSLGDGICVSAAKRHFAAWKKDTKKRVLKNHRSTIYCSALREGNMDDWKFLRSRHNLTVDVNERLVILKSLGCSRNTSILESHLLSVLSDYTSEHQIRKQDSLSILAVVPNSGLSGARYMLEFIEKHHLRFAEHYGDYGEVVQLVKSSAQSFTAQSHINEFEKYVIKNAVNLNSIFGDLKAILAAVKNELKWYSKNAAKIIKWLRKNSKNFGNFGEKNDFPKF